MMRDPETSSIRSSAPSYISQSPSQGGSELPPYSQETRLPPYTHPYLSPSQQRTPYVSSRAGASSVPRTHPPIPLISPDRYGAQSRQYEAVAARRHAKITSAAAALASSSFPEGRLRKRSNSVLPFENFSSLHPAPSTPHALMHSTSELFLCTCGRPNHRKGALETHLDSERSRSSLFREPSITTGETDHTYNQLNSVTVSTDAVAEETPQNSEQTSGLERETAELDAALLDAESKSWDFMFSQMNQR